MTPRSRCTSCGTEDVGRLYASGRMSRCKDCQRYYNLTVNARKVRKHGRTPRLAIDKDEFLAWARNGRAACSYCHITEADLRRLGIRSSIGLVVEALGIDRIDNAGDYTVGNIAFCCYACDKVKGNVFSDKEMTEQVGPAIAAIWRQRLGGSDSSSS